MLEPNKDLFNIFENSVNLAIVKEHEYLTLEHFLFSMLNDDKFAEILTAYGASVDGIKKDLENYIDNELKDLINKEVERPKKTNTVERVLNRAFTTVLFSGRQVIEPLDCFISIFSEKKSYAHFFIKKANIEKEPFLNWVKEQWTVQK